MNKRSGYSPEVRERAVCLVIMGEHEYPSRWAAIQSIAARPGCGAETLHCWMNKKAVDAGNKSGVT